MSRYAVTFDPVAVNAMLGVTGLSAGTFTAVAEAVMEELACDADRFLRLYPLEHESYRFAYDHPYQDAEAGCQYNFDFVCDGSAMVHGVVKVVAVECQVVRFDEPA